MNVSKASGAELAKAFILFFVLFSLFSSPVLATKIDSTFSCSNTNGETTVYSYLKSPGLQESGYKAGLMTGTFNYYKGDKAELTDKLIYYDGKVDGAHPANPLINHNATVTHILNVNFSGDQNTSKGISEFIAKGFYTDNRAVSAAKKFWFNTPNNTLLKHKFTQYPTNKIHVETTSYMSLEGIYDLDYSANAENAYFVFDDAAGFSNKTGARRIDWEQEGLLKGKQIELTNNLHAISAFKSRAGGEDWLPCTCLSVDPLNPPDLGIWPSPEAFAVLEDIPIWNNVNRRQVQDWRDAAGLLFPNTAGTLETMSSGAIIRGLQTSTTPLVQVESTWKNDSQDKNTADYTIHVSNLGNSVAYDVVPVLKLAVNLSYISGSATINRLPLEPYRPYNNGSLYWNIGDLSAVSGPDGVQTIELKAKRIGDANPDKSIASVTFRGSGAFTDKTTKPTNSNPFAFLPPVTVDSFYNSLSEQLVHYLIIVKDTGTDDLENVTLVDDIADGMQYNNGTTTIDDITTSDPEISNGGHTLTWHLGSLLAVTGPDGRRDVAFNVSTTNKAKQTESIAYVNYKVGTTSTTTQKVKPRLSSSMGSG